MPLGLPRFTFPFRSPPKRRATLDLPGGRGIRGVRGVPFWVHGPADRYVSDCLLKTGQMEPLETCVFLELIAGSTGFLDIGSNLGYYAVIAQHVGPPGMTCVAVEPDPTNLALLRRNVRRNAKRTPVKIIPAAVSDRPGTTHLHLSPDNFGDHQITPQSTPNRKSRRVRTITLAQLLASHPDIDLIKIDTQGAEAMILGNAPAKEAMSKRANNLTVVYEFWPEALSRDTAATLAQLPDAMGFKVFDLNEDQSRISVTCAQAIMKFYDDCHANRSPRPFTNLLMTRVPKYLAWLNTHEYPMAP